MSRPELPRAARALPERVASILASDDRRLAAMARLVAGSMLLCMAFSGRLWLSTRLYPLTPLFGIVPPFSWPLDAAVLGLVGTLLLAVMARPLARTPVTMLAALLVVLFAQDQSRLWPSFYSCFLLLLLLAGHDRSGGDTSAKPHARRHHALLPHGRPLGRGALVQRLLRERERRVDRDAAGGCGPAARGAAASPREGGAVGDARRQRLVAEPLQRGRLSRDPGLPTALRDGDQKPAAGVRSARRRRAGDLVVAADGKRSLGWPARGSGSRLQPAPGQVSSRPVSVPVDDANRSISMPIRRRMLT